MAVYQFGSGTAWGVRTDGAGPYTPLQFGILQEISLDLSFNIKELNGTYQFPVAIARGLGKIQGKAKYARMFARQWNDMFFGNTLTTPAELNTQQDESQLIAATAITVVPPSSGTFVSDLGLYFQATGIPLVKVASAPAVGQYTNAGTTTYGFNATDNGKTVLASYTYTDVTVGTSKITVTNQLLGTTPLFRLNFKQLFNGKTLNIEVNQCTSSKLGLATKLEDWNIPEFDFSAFADASNTLMTISLSE